MRRVPEWLVEVGADLRTVLGDEFRAEAEAEERVVADFRLRHRSITDVVIELMHRGSRATVTVPGLEVTGEIVHAAGDLATLAVAGGRRLHVHLESPLAIRHCTERHRGRGRSRDSLGCDSFIALMRSLELAGNRASLVGEGPAGGLTGRIATVALDHIVLVTGGTEWFVPLGAIYGVWEDRASVER